MKKKTIALLLVLVMIFGISVGGTIAYLTDKEAVTNTFTVGNVKIKLTETAVNEAGVPVDEKGSTEADSTDANWKAAVIEANDSAPVGNKYKLIPGMSYTKDPAVTVLEGSEESYIRMIVTVTDCKDVDAAIDEVNTIRQKVEETPIQLIDIFEGYDNSKWEFKGVKKTDDADYSRIYEFWYKETVSGFEGTEKKAVKLDPLFTAIKVPGEIDNDSLAAIKEMEIIVEAHAIQSASFADAEAAWGAWTVNN